MIALQGASGGGIVYSLHHFAPTVPQSLAQADPVAGKITRQMPLFAVHPKEQLAREAVRVMPVAPARLAEGGRVLTCGQPEQHGRQASDEGALACFVRAD